MKRVLFVGDQRCFLFSLRPVMKIHSTLPHNDHFLYLNVNQKALPNGLVSVIQRSLSQILTILAAIIYKKGGPLVRSFIMSRVCYRVTAP